MYIKYAYKTCTARDRESKPLLDLKFKRYYCLCVCVYKDKTSYKTLGIYNVSFLNFLQNYFSFPWCIAYAKILLTEKCYSHAQVF